MPGRSKIVKKRIKFVGEFYKIICDINFSEKIYPCIKDNVDDGANVIKIIFYILLIYDRFPIFLSHSMASFYDHAARDLKNDMKCDKKIKRI